MPDILKRFSSYKNTLTQHGAIAVIGLGMVASGFAFGSIIDPQYKTIISCSHIIGEVAALSLFLSYGIGLCSLHKDLSEDSDISPWTAIEKRKDFVKKCISIGISGGAATLLCMSIMLIGAKKYKSMKAYAHTLAIHNALESTEFANTVCLTPASCEITVAGKKSTIIVDKDVLQTTLFPDNTTKHFGTIAIHYTYDDAFGNNGKTTETRSLPITRQGPFDPKAAAEGRGCTPLKDFNFDN